MKSKFIILSVISAIILFFTLSMAVNAEEAPQEDVGIVIIESDIKGGDVIADIEEGKVGDVVTLKVSADAFYMLTSISVNGANLTKNENGLYTFQLVKGENKVSVVFDIDNDQIKQIAGLIDDVKDNGLSSILNVDNLFKIISWAITVFFGSGFFLTLIKNKKIKSSTIEEMSKNCYDIVEKINVEKTSDFLNNVMGKTIDGLTEDISEMKKVMLSMCKCMLLAQENTPEARLSIITELTNLKNDDTELVKKIQSVIKNEQEKNAKKIEDRANAINELKEANKNLEPISEKNDETEEEFYGQL